MVVARLRKRLQKRFHLLRREIHSIKSVQGIEIDRHRKQLSIHAGQHSMFVGSPFSELR